MENRFVIGLACVLVFAESSASAQVEKPSIAVRGPVELRVDDLKTPLGIDDPAPRFSWQLKDSMRGAKQTAYEVFVASSTASLASGKADIWDSGRIDSDSSLN